MPPYQTTTHLVPEMSALERFLTHLKVVIEVGKLNDDIAGRNREGEVNLKWQGETTQGN